MTDAQQPEHCDHECVCPNYFDELGFPCDGILIPQLNKREKCPDDTRTRPHTPEPETTEIIGLLATVEGFVPTAIRSEVMRLRERLTESLRRTAQEQR